MPSRLFVRKQPIDLIPLIFFLLTACSTSGPVTTLEAQPPTSQPEATATSTSTETPVSSPTLEPTKELPSTATSLPLPIDRPDLSVSLPVGNPERGRKLGLKYQCFTCHINDPSAPAFEETEANPGMTARVESRLTDGAYNGNATSVEEYLLESIIDPRVYIVDGEWEFLMNTYDVDKYSEEDLADLIAWLQTLN